MNKELSVAIIGGDSFVGKNLYKYLKNKNINVFCTSHKRKKNYFYLDLLSEKNKWPKINSKVAIICAGITSVNKCHNSENAYNINVTSTLKLIEKLTSDGVFVIFLSSSQVFDGRKPNLSRDDLCNPISIYAKQKYLVEKSILKNLQNKSILRITKILTPELPFLKNISYKLNNGLNSEAFNNYFISPVTIDMTCQMILNIILFNKEGVYQLSSSDQISYFDLARYYASIKGLNQKLIQEKKATKNDIGFNVIPRYSNLEMSKEKKLFNFMQLSSEALLDSLFR